MATFIHTADWHLGKPFGSVEDDEKRTLVREARLGALARIAEEVVEHRAEFVVVAGDLFDSPRPRKTTVSGAMAGIGAIGVPVYVIPGNHDHAGAESVWAQSFFQREREELAPNLQLLLEPTPVEAPGAVLFPAPLAHRQLASDSTGWLRSPEVFDGAQDRPRIVVAHGSVQGFSSDADEEGSPTSQPNFLDLDRLPTEPIDYIALGDWHGLKRVSERAWYAGTPEPDRFPKGEDHRQGHILVVKARRGSVAQVTPASTGSLGWHRHSATVDSSAELAHLKADLDSLLESRVREDLLRLTIEGALSLEARRTLDQQLESLRSRLLRLKLDDRVRLAPSPEELDAFAGAGADPLISTVARRLVDMLQEDGEQAPAAERALRDLYQMAGS